MWWTFAAACLASMTALAIAFGAYPWQKSADRKQQLLHERREGYRRFLEEANSLLARVVVRQPSPSDKEEFEHYLRVVAVSSNLTLYAPKDVIEACQKYSQELFAYMRTVDQLKDKYSKNWWSKPESIEATNRVRALRRKATISIRRDLEETGGGEIEAAVDAFFILTPVVEQT
ncbi:hypothetical protein [Ruegeria jejuensis]|uniref:hypothetical protein n=1 Tax=Ruegeria jejuensis TaxID=3233338 RepID=UPI00355C2BF3